jgi:ASC-1-like (ASCH) protein
MKTLCLIVFTVCVGASQCAQANNVDKYIYYQVQKNLGRVTIMDVEIEDSTEKEKAKNEKNMFLTNDYANPEPRTHVREVKIYGQIVKTTITIYPPRGHGFGGALPNSFVEMVVDGKVKVNSRIGYNHHNEVNVGPIVIHTEKRKYMHIIIKEGRVQRRFSFHIRTIQKVLLSVEVMG